MDDTTPCNCDKCRRKRLGERKYTKRQTNLDDEQLAEVQQLSRQELTILHKRVVKRRWVAVNLDFCQFLDSSDEVLFFSYLLNISGMKLYGRQYDKTEWKCAAFNCSAERVKRQLNMDQRKQSRLIAALVEKKLLWSSRRRWGRVRRIFLINYLRLEQMIDEVNQPNEDWDDS